MAIEWSVIAHRIFASQKLTDLEVNELASKVPVNLTENITFNLTVKWAGIMLKFTVQLQLNTVKLNSNVK